MVEILEKKVTTWNRQYLSLGRRSGSIKASMSNLPVYYMSMFNMPRAMVDKLDCIMRFFLSMRLMKGSEVLRPQWEGGLVIACH